MHSKNFLEKKMTTKEEFTRIYTTRQNIKYEPEKHIPLLYEIYNKDEGILAFCAEAYISKRTFHNWLHTYPDFKEAYDVVINIGGRRWENFPLLQTDFNFPYWSAIMRNRFGYGRVKFSVPKSKDPLAIINDVLDAIHNEEVSLQEATQITNIAATKANVENNKSATAIPSANLSDNKLKRIVDIINSPEEEMDSE
jgi:hypothetical protein